MDAHEYSNHRIRDVQIPVSCEYAFNILVNGILFSTIASSPSSLESLAAGHLYAEGIIKAAEDITGIEIDYSIPEINVKTRSKENPSAESRNNRELYIVSAGSIRDRKYTPFIKPYDAAKIPRVDPELILSVMHDFLSISGHHSLTHGVHSSALYKTSGEKTAFFDDIGRHNAIDKIIGHVLQKKISPDNKMLFTTGRLASEIVLKAINASIPVIISRASPTSLSFELAKNYNLIMIGKAREDRLIIFNGIDKIGG